MNYAMLAKRSEKWLCERRAILLRDVCRKRQRRQQLSRAGAPEKILNRMNREIEEADDELTAIQLLIGDRLDQKMKEAQKRGGRG